MLHRTLSACARSIAGGAHVRAILAEGRENMERAGFAVDYLELRDAASLAPAEPNGGASLRLLGAGRLGATRLLDNVGVGRERSEA